MGDAVGVFFRQLGHHLELLGVEPASGNLDTLHARRIPHGHGTLGQVPGWIGDLLHLLTIVPLAVVIALAVGAPAKAGFGKKALIQLALFSQRDLRFKHVNFTPQGFRYLSPELFFPK